MRVLTVNAGSSSLKLAVVEDRERLLARKSLDAPAGRFDADALEAAARELPAPDAIGHRVVHGGDRDRPVRVDAAERERLRALSDLAPLHQETALAAMEVVTGALGDRPAVACFDTAFHAGMPEAARTYALPESWRRRWPLRRYGFHGLSHAHAAGRAHTLTGARRIVVCHLGSGASVAAVHDGRSVDTSMGFTPLEGLVMATRSGSVDPGLLLWLLGQGVTPEELSDGLRNSSGLAGLAGTSDMREILARDDEPARLALAVYVHRLRGAIAAMTASLGGLDTLVFTGGAGEAAHELRRAAGAGLEHLGVAIDARRNREATPDSEIGAEESRVRVLVIASREDLVIARAVEEALGGGDSRAPIREA